MKKNKLTAVQRIDYVLWFMAWQAKEWHDMHKAYERMVNEMPSLYVNGENSYLDQMFIKLLEDKYLERNPISTNEYRISFKGIVFAEQGGYKGEIDRKLTSEVFQSVQTWITVFIAFMAMLASIGVFYFSYRDNVDYDYPPFYFVAISAIFAMIFVVSITMVALKSYKRKKSKHLP